CLTGCRWRSSWPSSTCWFGRGRTPWTWSTVWGTCWFRWYVRQLTWLAPERVAMDRTFDWLSLALIVAIIFLRVRPGSLGVQLFNASAWKFVEVSRNAAAPEHFYG